MIVILKQNSPEKKVSELIDKFHAMGVSTNVNYGHYDTVIALIGDTSVVDMDSIMANEIVSMVKRVSEPYKAANRKFHADDTIVEVGDVKIGQGYFNVIAGPCSVESEEQIIEVAKAVKKSGATMLRGGAFKPRTSPYSFQGLQGSGIELLLEAKKETGLPIVTEIMGIEHIDLFADVDVIQVGARNMQNFQLLKELGKCDKPILLKRGLANTIEEFLMSAEYIMASGNNNVILCERGIRTFETIVRNTLDITAVPLLKKHSHLPVIVDPSHSSGVSWLVPQLSNIAVAAGADGLIIEVHNNPECALCDGDQSLTPANFDILMNDIRRRAEFENKIMN